MSGYTILGIKFTKNLLPKFIKVAPQNSLYLKYPLPASHCPTPDWPSSVPYSQSKIPTWNWRAPSEELWKSLKAGTKFHWSKRQEKWSNSFFKLKPRIYQPSSWGHLALMGGEPNLSLQKEDGGKLLSGRQWRRERRRMLVSHGDLLVFQEGATERKSLF